MKYRITLVSSDNNILEFKTVSNTQEEAVEYAFKHIEKIGWEHFNYSVKYIDKEGE